MNILDILLGKKKTINHPILGDLTSQRIKGNNKTKTYSWYGEIKLDKKHEKTSLFLDGNNSEPNSAQINGIVELMNGWETKHIQTIEHKIRSKKLNLNNNYNNWKSEFYVGMISPIYSNHKKLEFEVTLEPINNQQEGFLSITYKDNEITELESLE
ncbi:hypothetical protein [Maribacter ulvicola]|uniref:Uncharacterized protein n=1 Tax=Maribacter ulvicola TaxID=228959 RepID=A0A1N6YUD8_9FLAO|nr:hypothetical protein [Maribacter ulvicola]SIR18039.1 hypothetical protein SAMN05421797_107143 [Maribacter ulvicola]